MEKFFKLNLRIKNYVYECLKILKEYFKDKNVKTLYDETPTSTAQTELEHIFGTTVIGICNRSLTNNVNVPLNPFGYFPITKEDNGKTKLASNWGDGKRKEPYISWDNNGNINLFGEILKEKDNISSLKKNKLALSLTYLWIQFNIWKLTKQKKDKQKTDSNIFFI